jgi:transposase
MRRGDSYGTLLVNLETHRPLDLLPDRTSEAVFPWLQSHPEIDTVSRDRAGAYADAINRALPHATQVADRYHLIQNLREHLQHFFDHKRSYLPKVSDTPLKGVAPLPAFSERIEHEEAACITSSPQGPEHESTQNQREDDLSCLTYEDRRKKISRDKRYARDAQVRALHQEGMGLRAIARHLGVSRNLVRRFVSAPGFPERAPKSGQRTSTKSKLAPYLPYLRERWEEGIHKSSQLFREIQARGFTGSQSLVRHTLSDWRAALPAQPRQGPPRKQRLAPPEASRRLSSRSASFLMILSPEKLTDAKRQQIEQIRQASSQLHSVYRVSVRTL